MEKAAKERLEEKIEALNQKVESEQISLDSDPDKKKIERFTKIAWSAVGIGAFFFLVGIYFFFYPTCSIKLSLNELGDYLAGSVGGLWALAGLFFIYVAFLGQKLQLKTQQLELKYSQIEVMSTRLELMGQKEQLVEQNATLRQQRFENTFFQLLSLHNEIIDTLQIDIDGNYFAKRECFKGSVAALRKYENDALTFDYKENLSVIRDLFNEFTFVYGYYFKHYFNNLYNIFKFVHLSEAITAKDKEFYADLAKAQLSDDEIVFLFYYILGSEHNGLKFLDQTYNILEHVNELSLFNEDHLPLYDTWIVKDPFAKQPNR